MGLRQRRRAEPSAGPFLGPDLLIAAPIRTLSDDYRDVPEPEDSDRVPEPQARGRVRRVLDKVAQRSERR